MTRAKELAKFLDFINDFFGDQIEEIGKEAAAELRRLSAENAELRARLDAIYSTEPVAWMLSDTARPFSEPWPTRVDSTEYHLASRRNDFKCAPLIHLPEKS